MNREKDRAAFCAIEVWKRKMMAVEEEGKALWTEYSGDKCVLISMDAIETMKKDLDALLCALWPTTFWNELDKPRQDAAIVDIVKFKDRAISSTEILWKMRRQPDLRILVNGVSFALVMGTDPDPDSKLVILDKDF